MEMIREDLERAINLRDESGLLSKTELLHYADLVEVYENANTEDRSFFLKILGPEKSSKVINELPDSLIETAMQEFKPAQQKIIVTELPDDDRVDLLQDVSDEMQGKLLDLLTPDQAQLTKNLLKYEEDSAGGRMTTAVGRININMTVREAVHALRGIQESTETLSRIFVLNDKNTLLGKIRLRDLAFNTWDTPIRDIMAPVEQTILATADQEEAAQMLSKYDLVVLPVVDEFSQLLGAITYDDALEILEEESTEDFEKQAGIAGGQSEQTYLNTSISQHFKRRSIWLVTLAFLAILSGWALLAFEDILTQLYILALYLPMVVAAGGNSGGQASTMVIRAMSLGELDVSQAKNVALKELKLGMLLGLCTAIFIALFTIVVLPAFNLDMNGASYTKVALAVAIALVLQVTTSTLVGSLLPLGARAIKLDPAVIASPAITTIVDVTGMVIYFAVAQLILGL